MKNHKELIAFLLFITVMSVSFYFVTQDKPQVKLRATPEIREMPDARYFLKQELLESEYLKAMSEQGNYL